MITGPIITFYWEPVREHYVLHYPTENLLYWHFVFHIENASFRDLCKSLDNLLRLISEPERVVILDYHYWLRKPLLNICKAKELLFYEHTSKPDLGISLALSYPLDIFPVAHVLRREDNLFLRFVPKDKVRQHLEAPLYPPEENEYIAGIPKHYSRVGFLSFSHLDLELVTCDLLPSQGEKKFEGIGGTSELITNENSESKHAIR